MNESLRRIVFYALVVTVAVSVLPTSISGKDHTVPLVSATLNLRALPEARKPSYVLREGNVIRLGNGFLEARFDASTQKLIGLVDRSKGQTAVFQTGAELSLEIGNPGKPLALEPKRIETATENGPELVAAYRADGWQIKIRYWLEPGQFYLRKQAELRRDASEPALISKLTLLNGSIAGGTIEQKINLNYQRVKDFQADCEVSFVRSPGEDSTGYFFVIEFPISRANCERVHW